VADGRILFLRIHTVNIFISVIWVEPLQLFAVLCLYFISLLE